jgi:hypothetical protein
LGSDGKCARGQVFSLDFIIAMTVFVVCIAFVNTFWQGSAEAASMAVARDRVALAASSASEALVAGSAYPDYCQLNDTVCLNSIGLAKQGSKNELSGRRLSEFLAMDYADSLEFLGLPDKMNYYFSVANESGTVCENGIRPASDAKEVAAVSRAALLNGTAVKVNMLVWQ